MKNTKKLFKVITIAAGFAVFGIGAACASNEAGSANSADLKIVNTQAAAGTVEELSTESYSQAMTQATVKTTTAASETTTAIAETTASVTMATEAVSTVTEAKTEANTEAPVYEEPATEAPRYEAPALAAPVEEAPAYEEPATEAPTEAPAQSEDDYYAGKARVNAGTYSSYINQVYNLINQERAAAGKQAVALDSSLTQMACHRAVENADNNCFTISGGHHVRPNGKNASSICYYYGIYGSYGENMGRYQMTPQEIVTGWHNSASHYACMTDSEYNRVGIGVAQDSEGYYYWIAIFMD
ncbi:MAG: CAP domain-containing protein [Eubacteriales bacterium]|nr:CAP domain-containing protein [Eubacteriales bacterium]